MDGEQQQQKKVKIGFLVDPLMHKKVVNYSGPEGASMLRAHMLAGMQAVGGELKIGPPPKNELERLLQQKLKSLQSGRR